MDEVDFHVVIPARMGSSRFPGKPLIDLRGTPMIVRVAEQARRSLASTVTVATDNQSIADIARDAGFRAILTSGMHKSGTDRVIEVIRGGEFSAEDIIVNLQGDEPLMPPSCIRQVALNLVKDLAVDVSTLCQPCKTMDEVNHINTVKVVRSLRGRALYFSRAVIPSRQPSLSEQTESMVATDYQRHVGIYGYRVRVLKEIQLLQESSLEQTESLEQLRFLENGLVIGVEVASDNVPHGVDTPEDANRIKEIIKQGADL